MSGLIPLLAAAMGGSALTWLIVRLRRRPPPPPVAPVEEAPAPIKDWDESWNPKTVQLAYEQSREMYRQADETSEVHNRKAVQVFAIASAIATVGPALGKVALWSDGWWLSVGAGMMWLLAAIECWRAFTPRTYEFDPDPATFLDADWLAASPGAFYFHRLEAVRDSVQHNMDLNNERGKAVRAALKCALVEVGFLLAALLWR